MTPELTYLAWAIILLLIHMAVQGGLTVLANGLAWGMGPRDDPADPGGSSGRAGRALTNYVYNFIGFAAAALALAVTGLTSDTTALGAAIWFWARVAYLPAYITAIPVVRSVAWLTSVAGLIMMILPLLGASG